MVSGTVAPGGVGKSSMEMVDALSMVIGRRLLHHWVHDPNGYRVWYWCGEDPREELDRRFKAACLHYEITDAHIGGRLFVDSGRDQPIKIVQLDEGGKAVAQPVKDVLIRQMRERKIDALIIDPFVTVHAVNENSNEQINVVIDAWRDIAHQTNAAIELVHHTNKAGTGDSFKDGRGASAFGDGIRGGRVLSPLSFEDGEQMGLDPAEAARITRVMNGAKPNMQPRGAHLRFFKMVSVPLNNGTAEYPNGDEIGVPEVWEKPDAFDGMDLNDLAKVQDAIKARETPPAAAPANHDWAGYVVAEVLGLDIGEPGSSKSDRTADQNRDRKRVTDLISTWLRSKALKKETVHSTRRGTDFPAIIVGAPAVDMPDHPQSPQSSVE
jgi:hypothetical protein